MNEDTAYALAGLSVIASIFMLGGLAGFLVCVTHEARMDRWAASVVKAMTWLNELEEKGDADAADRLRRRLGLAPDETAAEEHAVGVERGSADVLAESVAPVVDAGPGPSAVSAA